MKLAVGKLDSFPRGWVLLLLLSKMQGGTVWPGRTILCHPIPLPTQPPLMHYCGIYDSMASCTDV